MPAETIPTAPFSVADGVEALSYLEDIQKVLTAKDNPDLNARMKFDRYCNKIKLGLQSYVAALMHKDIGTTQQAATADQVTTAAPAPVSTVRAVRVDKQEISDSLKKAVLSYQEFLNLLAGYTPNADKVIISINTILPEGRQATNNFTRSVQTLKLVFSTNTASYVVSQDAHGVYSITPANYWLKTSS